MFKFIGYLWRGFLLLVLFYVANKLLRNIWRKIMNP